MQCAQTLFDFFVFELSTSVLKLKVTDQKFDLVKIKTLSEIKIKIICSKSKNSKFFYLERRKNRLRSLEQKCFLNVTKLEFFDRA